MNIKTFLQIVLVIIIALDVIVNCTWWEILLLFGGFGVLIGFVVFAAYAIGYGLENKYPKELYDPINFPNRSEDSSEDSTEDEPNVQ